jgi:hypothetical protein
MAAMAKKKEEWLAKLRGITTTDQNIDTPSTLTSNSIAKKKKLKLKDVITSSICTIVDRTCCHFFYSFSLRNDQRRQRPFEHLYFGLQHKERFS